MHGFPRGKTAIELVDIVPLRFKTGAPEDVDKWHKWFAVESNNRAWRLAEQTTRTPAEDEEMLNSAHAHHPFHVGHA